MRTEALRKTDKKLKQGKKWWRIKERVEKRLTPPRTEREGATILFFFVIQILIGHCRWSRLSSGRLLLLKIPMTLLLPVVYVSNPNHLIDPQPVSCDHFLSLLVPDLSFSWTEFLRWFIQFL
ncbi:hypothetical protein XENOCAPTIV_006708 [Xenoophorus captivus]|uniref:Uncharacterized protein n=1 Tax=Xenoophorus captivus TaxID=1517983 RepID=A0ABV0QRG6_9TELE